MKLIHKFKSLNYDKRNNKQISFLILHYTALQSVEDSIKYLCDKKNKVSCFNWGLVAGKSQTHFGWDTIAEIKAKKEKQDFLREGDEIPEPVN